ncbi:MAG: VWA domain-containing protein [Spirochaetes bacterium]|nr:VWA domain-containing protein [Spirochaetota bacterium]
MSDQNQKASGLEAQAVALEGAAERRLVRPGESARHVDYSVTAPSPSSESERPDLSLTLVVDRSGSMQGSKLDTAKAAALAVLERLEPRDRAAIVVFDSEVETILPEGAMMAERKIEARTRLSGVLARASTALHEGWLTGCRSIAAGSSESAPLDRLSRCFLLTDGLANQGLQDPEAIAAQAAEVRAHAGVGTSTFGIGDDYDEGLLGPMAVAGSGQFHHLRDEADIAATFSGELGELFKVTARAVRIEFECDPRIKPELISLYWGAQGSGTESLSIDIGDLIANESRHIVVRFKFSGFAEKESAAIRARVSWQQGTDRKAGAWREFLFTCVDNASCSAEPRSMAVMHWVGLHNAEKAKKEALDLFRKDDSRKAVAALTTVIHRLREYASTDPELVHALRELEGLRKAYKEGAMTRTLAKEATFQNYSSSRMQRDHRGPRS